MHRFQLLVPVSAGDLLSGLQCFLGFYRKFVKSRCHILLPGYVIVPLWPTPMILSISFSKTLPRKSRVPTFRYGILSPSKNNSTFRGPTRLFLAPCNSLRWVMRASLLGRCSLGAFSNVDLDCLRLRLFPLGHGQRQDAVFVFGFDIFRVDGARQSEAADKAAIGPLDPMVVLFLHLAFLLALPLKVECPIFNAKLKVLGIDAGKFGFQHQVMVRFVDVYGRRPCSRGELLSSEDVRKRLVKQTVESILCSHKVTEWFPSYNRHSFLPPYKLAVLS